jgi:hypothetical protein
MSILLSLLSAIAVICVLDFLFVVLMLAILVFCLRRMVSEHNRSWRSRC